MVSPTVNIRAGRYGLGRTRRKFMPSLVNINGKTGWWSLPSTEEGCVGGPVLLVAGGWHVASKSKSQDLLDLPVGLDRVRVF